MANITVDPRIVNIAIAELPAVINLIKDRFRRENPGAPEPTSEQVIAAYQEASAKSLTRDAELLAETRPPAPPEGTE